MGSDLYFAFHETAARAFVHRALRRWPGTGRGRGSTDPYDDEDREDWNLEPGWPVGMVASEGSERVEGMVWQAIHHAGAITLTDGRPLDNASLDLELRVEPPPDDLRADPDTWAYQWYVRFPRGAAFGLCSGVTRSLTSLGVQEKPGIHVKGWGSHTALAILREAASTGNAILRAYYMAGGRIPAAGG